MHQEMPQQPLQQQPVQQPPVVPPQGQFNQAPQMPQQPPSQGQFGYAPYVQHQMQPPYAPQENPGQTLGTISLVLGIASLFLACITIFTFGLSPLLGIPLAIAGFTCGIIGRSKTPQGMSNGVAVAGIILSAIGASLALILPTLWIFSGVFLRLSDFGSVVAGSDLQYLIDALANY